MSNSAWGNVEDPLELESLTRDSMGAKRLQFEVVKITVRFGLHGQPVVVNNLSRLADSINSDVIWFNGIDDAGMEVLLRRSKGTWEIRWPKEDEATYTPLRPNLPKPSPHPLATSWGLPLPVSEARIFPVGFKLSNRAVDRLCNWYTGLVIMICTLLWVPYGVESSRIAGTLVVIGFITLVTSGVLAISLLPPHRKVIICGWSCLRLCAQGIGMMLMAIVFAS